MNTYPTEVAGAEQLFYGIKTDDELSESGYATWRNERPTACTHKHPGDLLPTRLDWTLRTTRGNVVQLETLPNGLSALSDIERAADAFLVHATGDAMQDSVLRERTRANGVDSTWDSIVKADRVAWRGKPRFQLHSHRYATLSAFIVAGDGTCEDHRCVTYVLGRGYRFVGHTAVRATKHVSVKRAAARHATTSNRGRASTHFTATERTIRRYWAKADAGLVATADAIANALRMQHPGEVVPIADGFDVTVRSGDVIDADGRAFTWTSIARRAALARVSTI